MELRIYFVVCAYRFEWPLFHRIVFTSHSILNERQDTIFNLWIYKWHSYGNETHSLDFFNGFFFRCVFRHFGISFPFPLCVDIFRYFYPFFSHLFQYSRFFLYFSWFFLSFPLSFIIFHIFSSFSQLSRSLQSFNFFLSRRVVYTFTTKQSLKNRLASPRSGRKVQLHYCKVNSISLSHISKWNR